MEITRNAHDNSRYDISRNGDMYMIEVDDEVLGSQKEGISGYNWFLGPILSALGFAFSIKDEAGKTFWLNKNSAIKWVNRNQNRTSNKISKSINGNDLRDKIKGIADGVNITPSREPPRRPQDLSQNALVKAVKKTLKDLPSSGPLTAGSDTKPDLLAPIPVQTKEEAENVVQGGGVRGAWSPFYSQERIDRHINAQAPLHYLYNLGATLINKGVVASVNPKSLEDVPSTSLDVATLDPSSPETAEQAIAIQLKAAYEAIPKTTGANGRNIIQNSFKALFPILVGLNNVAPENIVEAYKQVKVSSNMHTMGFHRIEFPNGGQFGGDEVIQSILYYYMIDRPDTFESLITFDDKDASYANIFLRTGLGQDMDLEVFRKFMALEMPTSSNLLPDSSTEVSGTIEGGAPKIQVLDDE